jgi:hypothetical protein
VLGHEALGVALVGEMRPLGARVNAEPLPQPCDHLVTVTAEHVDQRRCTGHRPAGGNLASRVQRSPPAIAPLLVTASSGGGRHDLNDGHLVHARPKQEPGGRECSLMPAALGWPMTRQQ